MEIVNCVIERFTDKDIRVHDKKYPQRYEQDGYVIFWFNGNCLWLWDMGHSNWRFPGIRVETANSLLVSHMMMGKFLWK